MVAPTAIVGTQIIFVGAGIARPFFMVFSVVSIPGKRNKCIRSCGRAPLKKREHRLNACALSLSIFQLSSMRSLSSALPEPALKRSRKS